MEMERDDRDRKRRQREREGGRTEMERGRLERGREKCGGGRWGQVGETDPEEGGPAGAVRVLPGPPAWDSRPCWACKELQGLS